MKKGDEPIIVEEEFNESKEKLWDCITNIREMKKWYFDNIPDFRPEVGFRTQFNVESGERNFLHKWKVMEVIQGEKIVYNWQYEKYDGSADVEFTISEIDSLTKLQVKVFVLEDFPEDIPEFKRESCLGGWEYFIKNRLKQFLIAST